MAHMNRALTIIHNILSLIENDHESEAVDTRGWKRVGRQLGSNPGGTFEDEHGKQWYVKHSKSDDHARNEILGNEMLRHMGVPVLDHRLIRHGDGKLGTASPIVKIKPYDPDNSSDVGKIQKHLGAHALVANWDSVGLEHDNYAHTPNGLAHLDTGGSLKYRAQGAPKGAAFGEKAGEFDTLRDHGMNPQAAHVFGSMKPKDLVDTVRHTAARFKNSDLHALIQKHGPVDQSEKASLEHKMVARKGDLIKRANSIASQHGLQPVRDIDES